MTTEALKQDLATRHLLNDLSQAERDRSSERLFADDDHFEQLLVAEDELFDAYVRRELSAEAREQFERQLLSSPEQKQKLQFANALAQLVAEPAARVSVPSNNQVTPVGWWATALVWWRSPAWAAVVSVVVIIIAMVALWLFVSNSRLRRQLEVSESQRAAQQQRERELEQDANEQRVRGDGLAQQLDRERELKSDVNNQGWRERSNPSEAGRSPEKSAVLALLLSPSVLRDSNGAKHVYIAATTAKVELQLELEEGNQYQAYDAMLRNAKGQLVLRRGGLHARRVRGGQIISVQAPARSLLPGRYELELIGTTSNGRAEPVAFYYFVAGAKQ
jgi:hypothetical protein